jgi:hypothetical protein|tara:strand:+ start:452 stop:661 length:210 start_codon:yes stop_codon:yes gene_type:complete
MEEETYTFGEYFNEVQGRAAALSDEEKNTLGSLQASPQGAILAKLLGPDLTMLSSMLKPTPKRGLAARK